LIRPIRATQRSQKETQYEKAAGHMKSLSEEGSYAAFAIVGWLQCNEKSAVFS
jgi:hypothetical protein